MNHEITNRNRYTMAHVGTKEILKRLIQSVYFIHIAKTDALDTTITAATIIMICFFYKHHVANNNLFLFLMLTGCLKY